MNRRVDWLRNMIFNRSKSQMSSQIDQSCHSYDQSILFRPGETWSLRISKAKVSGGSALGNRQETTIDSSNGLYIPVILDCMPLQSAWDNRNNHSFPPFLFPQKVYILPSALAHCLQWSKLKTHCFRVAGQKPSKSGLWFQGPHHFMPLNSRQPSQPVCLLLWHRHWICWEHTENFRPPQVWL